MKTKTNMKRLQTPVGEMRVNRMKPSKLWFVYVLLLVSKNLLANNIAVSNVSLSGQVTVPGYTMVGFDISWDNSWRISLGHANWDAAWVFVKYRIKTEADWNHATLNWADGTGGGDGHTVPANATIASNNDTGAFGSFGVFIHRNADMNQANVSYTDAQLRWNYAIDGVNDADSVEIAVFAIEMVYVPQGGFRIGSGGTEVDAFYEYPTTTNTYRVLSEAAITVGTNATNLYYESVSNGGDQLGPIPAAFPKGYNAFYCMKYEITQEQYVAFLNTLTGPQGTARKETDASNRYAITGDTPGNYATSNPNVACGNLSANDLRAYLDWAALRPMTELEFEKACRGSVAVPNEYAWGTAGIAATGYILDNVGDEDEGIFANYNGTQGNAMYNLTSATIDGPVRVGIFAAHALTSGRVTAGASYYGIMELSGNLTEGAISVGSVSGRAFTGEHGNGEIDAAGEFDVDNWLGMGRQGGAFSSSDLIRLTVSYRGSSIAGYSNSRSPSLGGRGVRTAP